MNEPLITLGGLALFVAFLVALLLWSGGERPSWGDNADEPDFHRRRSKRAKDDDDDDAADGSSSDGSGADSSGGDGGD